MKKMLVLVALAVIFMQGANAAKVGDACQQEGALSIQGDKALDCHDKKWQLLTVGKQVLIHVQVLKGDAVIRDAYLATLDGQKTFFDKTSEHAYLAKTKGSIATLSSYKDGFYISVKPEIVAAGKIHLDFKASYAELDSMKTYEVKGERIQLPQMRSLETDASVVLRDGMEVEYPTFGDSGGKTSLDIAGQHFDVVSSPVYVLKLSASIAQ